MSCWKSTSREPCRSKNGIPRASSSTSYRPAGLCWKKRLRGRQTDSDDVIAGRLAKAREELDWIDRYDYVIVNDDLDKAVDEAASILKAEQCKVTRNAHRIAHTKELYK